VPYQELAGEHESSFISAPPRKDEEKNMPFLKIAAAIFLCCAAVYYGLVFLLVQGID
jgi:hypothetical protein